MSCHHESCPSRRLFFQQMGSAALATLALSGLAPNLVLAESVRAISGATLTLGQRAYPVPNADSVSVDEAAGVIIVRAANHLYAFSTECPHRGAQLEFLAAEKTIYCRKHKARFEPVMLQPEGKHLALIGQLITDGKLKPVIDKVFPLEDTAKALLYSQSGRAKGKIVIGVK